MTMLKLITRKYFNIFFIFSITFNRRWWFTYRAQSASDFTQMSISSSSVQYFLKSAGFYLRKAFDNRFAIQLLQPFVFTRQRDDINVDYP